MAYKKICRHCGAEIYSSITPVKCPRCGKSWKKGNPIPKSVATVNSVLRRLGIKERLAKGKGYYYWYGGDAGRFSESGVYVYDIKSLTVEDWVRDLLGRKSQVEENPIRHIKSGWMWGSQGPFPTRTKAVQVVQAVYASGYRRRNPIKGKTTPIEGVGNILTGLGLFIIPLFAGFIIWMQSRKNSITTI